MGMLSKVWKCFPLLRVLDLEGFIFIDGAHIDGVGHLIHLRYLSLRKTELPKLPSSLYDLKCLETLDLRVFRWRITMMKLRNRFDHMKRLRHLYLPERFEVEGCKKLKFPCSLMETIENFDTKRCETKEVNQMTKLRVFSLRKDNTIQKMEELKLLLETPVIKNVGQLLNSFRLEISWDIVESDMLALQNLPRLNFLHLTGFVANKLSLPPRSFPDITTLIFSSSEEFKELHVGDGSLPNLQILKLSGWKTGFTLSALEKLSNLKILHLSGIGFVDKLNFRGGIFPHLTELAINHTKELEELSFEDGALPKLQSFKLGWCEKLNKLTNIPNTVTNVELWFTAIGGEFEKLPCLQRLYIYGSHRRVSGKGYKMMFSVDSFPQLTQLIISSKELEELELGIGALPNLQRLDFYKCLELKKLPEGLPHSVHILCISPCIPGIEKYNTCPYFEPPSAGTCNSSFRLNL